MATFEVMHKRTKVVYKVLSVKNDKNGYPHFLIFNYYGHEEWAWISAKNFVLFRGWDKLCLS